ncbi:MAG: hypothetical protein Q4P72_03440 [Eubacteriales bacterium]|nr:hypothetical protein [Eubacteriales bacterium]
MLLSVSLLLVFPACHNAIKDTKNPAAQVKVDQFNRIALENAETHSYLFEADTDHTCKLVVQTCSESKWNDPFEHTLQNGEVILVGAGRKEFEGKTHLTYQVLSYSQEGIESHTHNLYQYEQEQKSGTGIDWLKEDKEFTNEKVFLFSEATDDDMIAIPDLSEMTELPKQKIDQILIYLELEQ